MNTLMKKKPAKAPSPKAKKKKPAIKKEGQDKFSLKRLLMGEEKPDLTELESGSTTILDILSPTTVDTKSRDYIVVDGVYHAYLYVTGYGYATTVGSCWLAPLVEAGEGVNLSFIFKRQPKDKILSKTAQTIMVNRSRMRDVEDTRKDFEELDSAISSGLYLKDVMNRQGEDFYYMHTLVEVVAGDPGAAGDGGGKALRLHRHDRPALRLQKRAGVPLRPAAAGPGPGCGAEVPAERLNFRRGGGVSLCLL